MDGRSQMRALSSRDIVRVVVEKHLRFKTAGLVFEEREPDDESARDLIAAYREGRSPPWMTAYLLGCLRAPSAYETVKQILTTAPRLLAESYAGVAMARIRGAGAEADLREIMFDGSELRVREGAAYGLSKLDRVELVPAVRDALARKRIRRATAAHVLRCLHISVSDVLTLLRSTDEAERALGMDLAWFVLERSQAPDVISLIQTAMSTVHLAPRTRRQLEERLTKSIAK